MMQFNPALMMARACAVVVGWLAGWLEGGSIWLIIVYFIIRQIRSTLMHSIRRTFALHDARLQRWQINALNYT